MDLGDEHQMVLELRPAHDPTQKHGFVGVVVSVEDLSVDDKFLYVSCWGTGELRQYDVRDPFHPVQTGSVRMGGIVGRVAHPARPDKPLLGGPQMVEVSRDGNRVYFTNSLYGAWDDQFYPDGVGAWMGWGLDGQTGRPARRRPHRR